MALEGSAKGKGGRILPSAWYICLYHHFSTEPFGFLSLLQHSLRPLALAR